MQTFLKFVSSNADQAPSLNDFSMCTAYCCTSGSNSVQTTLTLTKIKAVMKFIVMDYSNLAIFK